MPKDKGDAWNEKLRRKLRSKIAVEEVIDICIYLMSEVVRLGIEDLRKKDLDEVGFGFRLLSYNDVFRALLKGLCKLKEINDEDREIIFEQMCYDAEQELSKEDLELFTKYSKRLRERKKRFIH